MGAAGAEAALAGREVAALGDLVADVLRDPPERIVGRRGRDRGRHGANHTGLASQPVFGGRIACARARSTRTWPRRAQPRPAPSAPGDARLASRPAAQVVALPGRLHARADAVRGRRAHRPGAPALVGAGLARRPPARAHHDPPRRRGHGARARPGARRRRADRPRAGRARRRGDHLPGRRRLRVDRQARPDRRDRDGHRRPHAAPHRRPVRLRRRLRRLPRPPHRVALERGRGHLRRRPRRGLEPGGRHPRRPPRQRAHAVGGRRAQRDRPQPLRRRT